MAEKKFPCWKVQVCPPEKHDGCPAYRFKQNCWETVYPISCCKRRNKARCTHCQVLITSSEEELPIYPVMPRTKSISKLEKDF